MGHVLVKVRALLSAVLDSNVWLDLLLFDDPRSRRLRDAIGGRHLRALSNEPCQQEWQRILNYPSLGLDDTRRHQLLQQQALMVTLLPEANLQIPPSTIPRCRDPDDQKFVDLAVFGRANYLFSRDLEVLRLASRCQRRFSLWIGRPEDWQPPVDD